MNYLYIKVLAIALSATIMTGCASSIDSEPEQSNKQEAEPNSKLNTEPKEETANKGIEPIDSLNSEQLQTLQAQIEAELSQRNIENSSKQNTIKQDSVTSQSNLIGLENTPSPNKEMVLNLEKLGVFDNLDWNFNLLEPITRGQFLALLYYANNAIRDSDDHIRLAPSHQTSFTDIDTSHPMYKYVRAFDNAGFSVGYPNKTFKPDQPITREETIGIKLPVDEGTPNSNIVDSNPWKFSDIDRVDPKFVPYLHRDYVTGYPNIKRAFGKLKSFKPKQEVYGYEAAGMVSQFKQHNAEKAVEKLE